MGPRPSKPGTRDAGGRSRRRWLSPRVSHFSSTSVAEGAFRQTGPLRVARVASTEAAPAASEDCGAVVASAGVEPPTSAWAERGWKTRIAVAGGGGGAGGPGLRDLGRAGGAGGGSQGQPGADGSGPVAGGGGGGGGTQNSVGGPGFHGGFAGTGATGGTGGAGTVGAGNGTGGGGGGGGYFGGGGGGAGSGSGDFPGGGGGGGSAFGPPGSIFTSGVADGPDGLAVIVTNPGSAPTLSGNPTPATILHPYSYNFVVAGSPAPNVVVSEGTLPPGLSLSLGGQLSGTPQTAGRYPFTVAASNGVLPDASLPAVIVVTGAPARLALSSSANPAEFSQPVTLSALVSPNSTTVHLPVPTGTVQFFDGTESLGTATLVGAGGGDATATLGALNALPVATHTITATYSGDSVFALITGPPLNQVIANVATVTKVASSANPADFDQAITFTATVLRHGPASVEPTGSVVFTIDGVSRPAIVLQNGSAALTPQVAHRPTHSASRVRADGQLQSEWRHPRPGPGGEAGVDHQLDLVVGQPGHHRPTGDRVGHGHGGGPSRGTADRVGRALCRLEEGGRQAARRRGADLLRPAEARRWAATTRTRSIAVTESSDRACRSPSSRSSSRRNDASGASGLIVSCGDRLGHASVDAEVGDQSTGEERTRGNDQPGMEAGDEGRTP